MDIKPGKLVCIFAHPDDEAFGPGGAIAQYAKKCPVHIICVTDGDANEDSDLGQVRKKEMQASATILGVESVTFLGFHDGTLSNNLYHPMVDAIQKVLDTLKPDTLMTFDLNGISGHIDHMAVASVTSYIFRRQEYCHSLMYYCEGPYIKELGDDYFVFVPPGKTPNEVNLTLDVTQELPTKIQAMHQHVSQKDDCDWILETFKDHLTTELFTVWRK